MPTIRFLPVFSRRSRPPGHALRAPLTLLLLGGLLLCAVTPAAAEVATVLSSRLAPYVSALEGFRDVYSAQAARGAGKTIQPVSYREYVVEELGAAELRARLGRRAPELVVAVGRAALEAVAPLSRIPVVYLMVPVPLPELSGRAQLAGVPMEVSPEQWVEQFALALPGRTRAGVAYDPLYNAAWVERARAFAALAGIELRAVAVAGPDQVPAALQELRGRIDALWVIPDLSVVTPSSEALLAEFSMRDGVPLFSFTERHLSLGATAAFLVDPASMGRAGAALARRLSVRADVAQLSVAEPLRAVLRINPTLARRFRLDTSGDASR